MPLEIKKIGTLEIESSANRANSAFLIIQKFGIIIMSIIVLAAILGFFGSGIFGKTIKSGASIQIQYDKFARLQATNIFHITISPLDKNEVTKNIQLAINDTFFKKISIKSISPEPAQQEIKNNKIIYTFLATQIQNGATINLVVEPEEFGTIQAEIGIISPKEDIIQINQFIYP